MGSLSGRVLPVVGVVAVALYGAVGSQIPTEAAGEFVVVDSTGEHVGIVLGPSGNKAQATAVALRWDDQWIPVSITRDSFGECPVAGDCAVYFAEQDCEGQAYLILPVGQLQPFPAAHVVANALYVESGPTATLTTQSSIYPGLTCSNSEETGNFFTPVDMAVELDFTPPFSMKRIPASQLQFFTEP